MATVSGNNDELSPDFVQRQRTRLESLRDQLLHDTTEAEAEERGLSERHRSEVQDAGDEGAIEAARVATDALSAEHTARLAEIQRALEKIEEGSYGLSDESGETIGQQRLEAMPQACLTVEEEAERER